jgi:hypothetical protein
MFLLLYELCLFIFNYCIVLNFLQAWIYDHFENTGGVLNKIYKKKLPRARKYEQNYATKSNGNVVVDGSDTSTQHYMEVL